MTLLRQTLKFTDTGVTSHASHESHYVSLLSSSAEFFWFFDIWIFQTISSDQLCQFVPKLKSVTKFTKSFDIHKNDQLCQFVPKLKSVTKFTKSFDIHKNSMIFYSCYSTNDVRTLSQAVSVCYSLRESVMSPRLESFALVVHILRFLKPVTKFRHCSVFNFVIIFSFIFLIFKIFLIFLIFKIF